MSDAQGRPMSLRIVAIGQMIHIFFGVGLALFFVVFMPGLADAFADMGTRVPWATALLVRVSQVVEAWWFVTVPVWLALIVADVYLLRALKRRGARGLATAWAVLGTLLCVGATAVLVIAVGLPYAQLVQNMNASG